MLVRRLARKVCRKLLLAASVYPTRLTDGPRLRSLIDRLRPSATASPLLRLGPDADGGYLVPDDLNEIEACFSPGVSVRSGFEKDCAERGIKVYMADGSVDGPAESHDLFHFTRKHLGVSSDEGTMVLDDWVRECVESPKSDLLLQMDIEGHEYEVLLGMSGTVMNRFRVIVIEFHWLDYLLSEPFFRIASIAFDRLLQNHTCVHIHPNNCCGVVEHGGLTIPLATEFTFLRNDRVVDRSNAIDFPHPLDHDNTRNPTLPLPPCWYR